MTRLDVMRALLAQPEEVPIKPPRVVHAEPDKSKVSLDKPKLIVLAHDFTRKEA